MLLVIQNLSKFIKISMKRITIRWWLQWVNIWIKHWVETRTFNYYMLAAMPRSSIQKIKKLLNTLQVKSLVVLIIPYLMKWSAWKKNVWVRRSLRMISTILNLLEIYFWNPIFELIFGTVILSLDNYDLALILKPILRSIYLYFITFLIRKEMNIDLENNFLIHNVIIKTIMYLTSFKRSK
jgi:hypothetical protein